MLLGALHCSKSELPLNLPHGRRGTFEYPFAYVLEYPFPRRALLRHAPSIPDICLILYPATGLRNRLCPTDAAQLRGYPTLLYDPEP